MAKVDERRIEERSDCDLAATIEVNGRSVVCIVKDISTVGARIEIDPTIPIPDQFDLCLPAVPGADQRFHVAARWRRGRFVGGEFVQL